MCKCGSHILVPSFRLFFLFVCLIKSQFYFILFYYFHPLESFLFSNERQKRCVNTDEFSGGTWRTRWRETHNHDILCMKELQ